MSNNPRPPGRRQERLENVENRLTGIYGDHIKQKRKGMVRILFQNPQGLGPIARARETGCQTRKITSLKDTILKHNIDFVGLSEVNKDWRLVPQQESMWSLTEGWFEYRRLATSINSCVPPTRPIQYGGTLLLAMNMVAHAVVSIDEDPTRMGRWTSMLMRGKNNTFCRIITAYCPCISDGPTSTYALQIVAMSQRGAIGCPREKFWEDLATFITTCQNKKENVIIMGDWNSEYAKVIQWMAKFGLKDIIHSRHTTDPPPTCNKSQSSPIDIIFAPTQFTCWRGGFLSFDYLEGDHRGLWCDIPAEYLLGYNMQYPLHSKARRLKTDDPRVRKRYLKKLHTLLKEKDIYNKFQDFSHNAVY
jgi:hypothetical protein